MENYEKLDLLKETDTRKLYKAYDKKNDCTVILKSQTDQAHQTEATFLNSIWKDPSPSLGRRYITKLYDSFTLDEKTFYATDFTEKTLLNVILDLNKGGRRMDVRLIMSYLIMLSQALSYLHSQNISHLDISPENVLLIEDELRLSNFDSAQSGEVQHSAGITEKAAQYMAPELFERKKCNGFKADIWSLGVLLWSLLCGSIPYDRPSLSDERFKRLAQGSTGIEKLLRNDKIELPSGAIDLLSKMLSVDPDTRPSASDILAHPWLASDSSSPPSPLSSLSIQVHSKEDVKAASEEERVGKETSPVSFSDFFRAPVASPPRHRKKSAPPTLPPLSPTAAGTAAAGATLSPTRAQSPHRRSPSSPPLSSASSSSSSSSSSPSHKSSSSGPTPPPSQRSGSVSSTSSSTPSSRSSTPPLPPSTSPPVQSTVTPPSPFQCVPPPLPSRGIHLPPVSPLSQTQRGSFSTPISPTAGTPRSGGSSSIFTPYAHPPAHHPTTPRGAESGGFSKTPVMLGVSGDLTEKSPSSMPSTPTSTNSSKNNTPTTYPVVSPVFPLTTLVGKPPMLTPVKTYRFSFGVEGAGKRQEEDAH